jgi:hypothetical protein
MMSEQFAPSPPIAPMQNKSHQTQNGSAYHQTMTTGITNVGAGLNKKKLQRIENNSLVPHFGGNLQHLSTPKTKATAKNAKSGKKLKKERITKEDIGLPTNFT